MKKVDKTDIQWSPLNSTSDKSIYCLSRLEKNIPIMYFWWKKYLLTRLNGYLELFTVSLGVRVNRVALYIERMVLQGLKLISNPQSSYNLTLALRENKFGRTTHGKNARKKVLTLNDLRPWPYSILLPSFFKLHIKAWPLWLWHTGPL